MTIRRLLYTCDRTQALSVADVAPHKHGPTKQFIAKVKTEAYLESWKCFSDDRQGEMQLFAFGMDDASSTAIVKAKPRAMFAVYTLQAVTVPKKRGFEIGFSVSKKWLLPITPWSWND